MKKKKNKQREVIRIDTSRSVSEILLDIEYDELGGLHLMS